MKQHGPLMLILALYAVVGALFAERTPAWQNPDEPAHWNYTRHIWQTGRLPVIENDDWDAALVPIKPDKRDIPVLRYTYEDHQPPLFYALAVPVFGLADGALLPLRLFALALGTITVIACYGMAWHVFAQRGIALFAAALVALLPQHLSLMAAFNNDALSEALLACALWVCVSTMHKGHVTWPRLVLLALVAGLCMFTKAQAYLAVPLAGLTVLWLERRSPGRMIAMLAVLGVIACAIPAQWWARNASLYGATDLLGLQRHNAVVVGQPTTAQWIGLYGMGGWLGGLLQTTFQSFWGQFGWMSVLPRREFYWLALLDTALTTGFFIGWWRKERHTQPHAAAALTLMAVLFAMTLAAFGWYNAQFYQAQGRYLYPALVPMAIAASLGWHWATTRWLWIRRWLWLALAVGLAAINTWLLFRVILPGMQ